MVRRRKPSANWAPFYIWLKPRHPVRSSGVGAEDVVKVLEKFAPGFVFCGPERGQDLRDILGGNIPHRQRAEGGGGVAVDHGEPLLAVFVVAQFLAFMDVGVLQSGGEGLLAGFQALVLPGALEGKRVVAQQSLAQVLVAFFAGHFERDGGIAAEADIVAASLEAVAVDPFTGTGGRNNKIEARTVAVPSRGQGGDVFSVEHGDLLQSGP